MPRSTRRPAGSDGTHAHTGRHTPLLITRPTSSLAFFRTVAAAVLLGVALSGDAAELRYTDGLAPEAQIAAGIRRLTSEQLTVLNRQIGQELSLARAGDVRGFAGTFSGRRTAAERTAAGIDQLTDEERARIDGLVATLLANPAWPTWPVTLPRARDSSVEPVSDRPRLHGQVTAMVGWGSGGYSTYGGSISTHYYDPARRFSASVEISDYRTDHGNLPRYLTRGRR